MLHCMALVTRGFLSFREFANASSAATKPAVIYLKSGIKTLATHFQMDKNWANRCTLSADSIMIKNENQSLFKGEMSHAVEITKMKISIFYHLPVTQDTLEKIQKFLCCSVVEIRGGENSNSRSVGAVHPIASRHRLTMSAMCGKASRIRKRTVLRFNRVNRQNSASKSREMSESDHGSNVMEAKAPAVEISANKNFFCAAVPL
jgi:hypothetical protein